MKNEDKMPLIDAFLTGRLSINEQRELKILRSDPDFEEEFVLRQQAYQSAKIAGRQQLKSRFKALDQPAKVIKFRYWWVAAAVAAILLISLPFLFNSPPSSEALFAEYYAKMPNKLAPITRGEHDGDPLKLGFIQYQRNNYAEAQVVFRDELSVNPDVELYLGIIALEEDRLQEAITIFSSVFNNKENRFSAEAQWFLALAYLADSNNMKAIGTLKEIRDGKNRYRLRAKALLKDLEQ